MHLDLATLHTSVNREGEGRTQEDPCKLREEEAQLVKDRRPLIRCTAGGAGRRRVPLHPYSKWQHAQPVQNPRRHCHPETRRPTAKVARRLQRLLEGALGGRREQQMLGGAVWLLPPLERRLDTSEHLARTARKSGAGYICNLLCAGCASHHSHDGAHHNGGNTSDEPGDCDGNRAELLRWEVEVRSP